MRYILAAGAVLVGFGLSVMAQEPASETAISRFNLSTGGTGLYRPERWGMIKVSLRNPQDHDAELLVTTHLESDPQLQYGRRIWLPPQSRAVAWHPLRLPPLESASQDFFDLRSLVIHTTAGVEAVAENEVGATQFDQAFRVAKPEVVTAAILDLAQEMHGGTAEATTQDLILTARYDRGLSHNFTLLSDPLAPAAEEVLDAVDHLILASPRIQSDGAGIAAIRRWVAAGGQLWIMADRVPAEVLAALLGDEDRTLEVDRVELSSVKFQTGPRMIGGLDFERDLERPAPFVRLLVEDAEIEFTVNDWPAAFFQTYGAGRILVTTLGADAWLSPRTSSDRPPPTGATFQTPFVPSGPLAHLGVQFFVPRPVPSLPAEVAAQQAEQLIGYSIPDRSLVLGTLIGFTALILAAALWAWRRGRLEQVGLAVPVLAAAASGILLSAGWTARSAVPVSTAVVQVVQPVPGTSTLRSFGTLALFPKGPTPPDLSSSHGGFLVPDMSGLEGTTRRLIWTDFDTWSWDNVNLPPGLRQATFQTSGSVAQPVEAVATFGPASIHGRLALPEGLAPSDAILSTLTGRMGLAVAADGTFESTGVLGSEEYLSASVLTDEQQRRSAILARLVFGPDVLESPQLLVWTPVWPVVAAGSAPRAGSALVQVPLRWQRPPAGTSLSIPEPFLPVREVSGPDGTQPPGIFDQRVRKWMERSGPVASWLGFQVPPAMLPLRVTTATITFQVLGPLNRLELSRPVGDSIQSQKIWNAPVGTLSYEMTDPDGLALDADGRLLVRIDVGNKSNAPVMKLKVGQSTDPANYWQFESVSLKLSAEVPARD